MMRPLLLLLIALGGCAKPPAALGDPSLPEAVDEVDPRAPEAELEAGATSLDPGTRARALHLLVRTTDDVDAWSQRALYDPSTWVQREAIAALAAREEPATEALLAYVEREGADPTVRALAALALSPGEVDLSADWQAATRPWDRLPLALAAWHHGDPGALDGVDAALRTGELPLDAPLFDALVRHGEASLLPALAEAQELAEPELYTILAAARLRLGDPKGEVHLRKALGGDAHECMEVLDQLATWNDPTADALMRKASSGSDLVRTHAELLITARTGQQPQRLAESQRSIDWEVRLLGVESAAQALAHGPADRSLAKAAVLILREATTDPEPSVRAAAARALGDHGGGGAHRDVLQPLLADERAAVRLEAAGALLR